MNLYTPTASTPEKILDLFLIHLQVFLIAFEGSNDEPGSFVEIYVVVHPVKEGNEPVSEADKEI